MTGENFAMLMDQADRFRDRVIASVAHAVPANEGALGRLMALRISLDGINSAQWYGLAALDQAVRGVEAGIKAHVTRIAAGASFCADAETLLAPFAPLIEAARRQRAIDASVMEPERWGPPWR